MKDILVVIATPDHRREMGRRCIESVRATDLSRAELVIFDNGWDESFSHPQTMERFRRFAGSRPIVFLDDDVEIVTLDWIDRLEAAHRDTGANVVGCRHRDPAGAYNHLGGLVFRDGTTEILSALPSRARDTLFVPAVSSAVVYIADPRQVQFDLAFDKYQHDLDIGLQTWQQGGRVACCPDLEVVHVMGGYATTRPEVISRFWPDADRFREKWEGFASGALYEIPELAPFAEAARGSNWLIAYRSASAMQEQRPAAAAAIFRRVVRDCATPERVSGAHFHLYQIEGDPRSLERCLAIEPEHRKARELLDEHHHADPRRNRTCEISGTSSSPSQSRRPVTSTPQASKPSTPSAST